MTEQGWDHASMFVMKTLESVENRLEKIQVHVAENEKTLKVLENEMKLRASMYGAVASLIVAAVLKYALGG